MTKTLWICLLTLAVVMLFCESEANFIHHSCCMKFSALRKTVIGPIKECYEQKPRKGCPHAYFIITNSGNKICLKPDLPWLKDFIQKGAFNCPPVMQISKGRFEVLDEDDVE